MSEKKRLVVLISNGVSDRRQSSDQLRALLTLNARKTPYVEVDGMDPKQRERRNMLFKVSGIRANYPQFFFEYEDGTFEFIGNWEKVEGYSENSTLPQDILDAHPSIETWDTVFGNVVETF